MVEHIGDSLPAIISTAIAMITMSAITLFVARKSGISDLQAVVSRESDRLVMTQAKRIELLETRVKELEEHLAASIAREKEAMRRIDKLEKLVSDEQIRKLLHD